MLIRLADVGVECAAHFRATDGQDLPGIIAFERRADKLVDEIHELLDNAFIMRFDIPDAMRLTDEIDDVIDGMRGAAAHIDIYKIFLSDLRPEARELILMGERSIQALRNLIATLKSRNCRCPWYVIWQAPLTTQNRKPTRSSRWQSADSSANSLPVTNTLEFIALEKLYGMLEEMTDDAKRCGKLIVSLARKEA